jgi:transposase-like protein
MGLKLFSNPFLLNSFRNGARSQLLKILHPKGLHCPSGHAIPAGQAPHDRQRTPIVKYKCRECGKVFHIFTGTDLSGSHYTCGQIVLILRGFLQGQTTQHIAEELGLD